MENCSFNVSELPDDIMFYIFCKLNVKEQARARILSSKWNYLWKINTCLYIDFRDFPDRERDWCLKTSEKTTWKFVDKVDQILKMHRGQTLEKVKITYPFLPPCLFPSKVDGWLNIAKQKHIKALYLDFQSCDFRKDGDLDRFLIFSLGYTTFSSLVTLHLNWAYLTDDIIHGVLSNSPNLLELSIVKCNVVFKHLNISGSSLKLKHLDLQYNYIRRLEISAPNLVSFNFVNPTNTLWTERICFMNIPLLSQLSCSLAVTLPSWSEFYVLLPQLVTLTLTYKRKTPYDISIPPNFPVLINLKKMYVRLSTDNDYRRLLALFKASPSLCRLWLSFRIYKWKHNNSIENIPDHKFLKEIVIYNFKGFESVVELLICIAQSCSSLQKIILHSRSYKRDYYIKLEPERVESGAKKLVTRIAQYCSSLRKIIIHQNSNERDYHIKDEQEMGVESVVKKLASRLPQKELEIVFKAM